MISLAIGLLTILITSLISLYALSGQNKVDETKKGWKWKNFTKDGKSRFLIIAVLLLGFAGLIYQNIEQSTADLQQKKNWDNQKDSYEQQITELKKVHATVTSVEDCIAEASDEQKRAYQTMVEVSAIMNDLNTNSSSLITDVKKTMRNLENLNSQINQIGDNARINLLDKRPDIQFSMPKWERKDNKNCVIVLKFKNSGERTADNFSANLIAFKIDGNGQVVKDFNLGMRQIPCSIGRLGGEITENHGTYPINLENFKDSAFIISMKYRYSDLTLGEEKNDLPPKIFMWKRTGMMDGIDSLTFQEVGTDNYNVITQYMKAKKIYHPNQY